MRENSAEVAVGAVVLAATLGFLFYVTQVAGVGGMGRTYDLTASFRSVEGISAGTDIRLAGVKIGTVSRIDLNPDTFRGDVTLSLLEGIVIPDDSAAVIASEGLLGGNFVEIVPGGSLGNFSAGAEIEDTQGAVSLISLLLKFVTGEGEDDA
ncbi:phospholipid/cholesterol/gamma-HCH transport system substrate-binding protein [Cognatiyoonia koreensis]|uniref:Phospholipid/cholesterol/gamma-HCH transport system substrate-binding protein n=1 Tax=Cognatiyoonia koreensis TaxID=364200 RepID=A0A1I0Q0T7_9RHOB|nr:outer membrane lipid asymmetry maintenance protein MlaD [Cognatiyoonia koreensis]SEW20369.1 phospholipid/cholesterol/gamma-HCH transport system substrate-binding protein [Cognatiyoonia koreensis]